MNNITTHTGKASSFVFALIGNLFVVLSDVVNSNGFIVFMRLLGIFAMILTIINIVGILDPLKESIKRKLFKK